MCLFLNGRFDETVSLISIDVLQVIAIKLHPRILQDILRSDTLLRLFLEQFLQEKASRCTHVIWKL